MFKKSDIQDIYSLSPMQEGMLFHHLMDRHSTAYFEQATCTVTGQIELNLLEIAFEKMVEKYDILRTVFIFEKIPIPQQVVLKRRKTSIYFKDISYLNKETRRKAVENFKEEDKKSGFNLSRDILFRISVIKTTEETYEFILSFHHIIMDGWCVGIIFKELLEKYILLNNGKPLKTDRAVPYGTYIKWLEKQDKKEGLRYWQKYLDGYNCQSPLHNFGKQIKEGKFEIRSYDLIFDKPLTEKLKRIAKINQVTENTFFQVVWGILLQRYNNTDDVVFGMVVSGRPSEIDGIENMVGLFINTVPVRIKQGNITMFSELLKKVQREAISLKSYEFLPLAKVQSYTTLKNKLIDHLVIFKNYPLQELIKCADTKEEPLFEIENFMFFEQNNYNLNILVIPGNSFSVRFGFNCLKYENRFIEKMASHLKEIVIQVLEKDVKLDDITLSHNLLPSECIIPREDFTDFGF